ncbi:hypothetical protein [Immundisolibacter sp.]|uniref:hypothetical protein n=1 Tax=Immundisolibacter sp. TaxID=1934948 RepID=UPI002605DB48|nr:hypothetical protein [Immundisolibacter sp.]MDD3651190.1 hypothetical protein [Immundisolibacter sp.]
MSNVIDHPAAQPVPAVDCTDAMQASVADLRAAAGLLHTVARHTRQPLDPEALFFVARVASAQADDLDYIADLWRRLPADPLLPDHRAAIAGHVATLRQHAEHLGDCGDVADTCPPSRAHVAATCAALLATADALSTGNEAAWTACRTQPAPAA